MWGIEFTKQSLKIIEKIFIPFTCLFCGSASELTQDICQDCLLHLPRNSDYCQICGGLIAQYSQSIYCRFCSKQPPYFDYTIAPFLYRDQIQYLILQLKINPKYAKILAQLFINEISITEQLPQAIIPVPLYKKDYQKRGFNQNIELAKMIASYLKIPLLTNVCVKHRQTLAQKTLSAIERQQNIYQAFEMQLDSNYKHIAIIDDLMTTGSTVNEIARIAKQKGIDRVDIWVIARSIY
ncbi:MAG: hypothetical protein RL637_760 [Pseudomonadota bacterium]